MNAYMLAGLCLAHFLHSYSVQGPLTGNGGSHSGLDLLTSINLVKKPPSQNTFTGQPSVDCD